MSNRSSMERRLHQQEVVASLGQQALSTDDLDGLMHEACVAVTRVLDTDYCKVLELLPRGDALLLRQGIGWQPGTVGTATVPTDSESQAGYTLISEEPVIVDDLRTEARFFGPDLLTDHDVVSGVSVIIGSIENPWGVLGTHTTDQRDFADYDATFVQSVANVLASAIERHAYERELSRYRALTEAANDIIVTIDDTSVIQSINPAVEAVLGYEPESLVGESLTVMMPDELKSRHRAALTRYLETGERTLDWERMELTACHHDGRELPVAVSFSEVEFDGDRFFTGIIRDITEQKAAERDRERRYEAIFNQSYQFIGLMEPDGTLIEANDSALEFAGITEEDVLGEPFWETYWWQVDTATQRELREAIERAADGEFVRYDVEVQGAEETIIIDFSIRPVTDEDGTVEYLIPEGRNITELKSLRERERELAQANRRTELALDVTDTTVWVWDFESDSVRTHPDPHGLFGMSVHTSDDFGEAIHPADLERVERGLQEAIESGEPYQAEYRYLTEGETRWAEDYGEIFEPSDMDHPQMIGVVNDITERKEREQELQRTREWMEFALEATDSVIWTWDVDSNEATFYPDEESLYGRSVETLEEFQELIHPDDREDVEAALRESLETGEPKHEEVRFVRDGEVRWLEAPGKPIEEADGTVRMIGIARDITARKEQEEELYRLFTLLKQTERTADVGSWELDTETMEFFWSDQLFEIVGFPAESEEPSLEEVIENIHYDDQSLARTTIEAAIEDGAPFDIEVRFLTPDGEVHWLRLQGEPEVDDEGAVTRVRGAAQDITRRKERERALEASHQRLEEFASAVSHDLREPLGTVASYLQLLERRFEEDIDADAEQFIDFAVDGASRMQEMIDGLVTTYAEVGTHRDEQESVDLDELVDDVLVDLQSKLEETNADVDAGPLPMVDGVRGQLRQLFMNLIDNAIKYAGDDPPRVHITAETDSGMHRIEIRDEGIGIPPSATERIFEVFTRLHPEETYPGTGIGLALCHRIVEHHGGEIWVESDLGEGSTFVFTLPADEMPDR